MVITAAVLVLVLVSVLVLVLVPVLLLLLVLVLVLLLVLVLASHREEKIYRTLTDKLFMELKFNVCNVTILAQSCSLDDLDTCLG